MYANAPLVNPTDDSVQSYWKNNNPPTCSCTNEEFAWWAASFDSTYQVTRVQILPLN